MSFLAAIGALSSPASTSTQTYTHPFSPPIPIVPSPGKHDSKGKEGKPFAAVEHYTAQLRAQTIGYASGMGVFGTSQFPPDAVKVRRVDEHSAKPMQPGQEAKLVVELDTTHAPKTEDWRRAEVRWFGCLTTWEENSSNGSSSVQVDHRPLFAFAAPLWNNGSDTAVGGSTLRYDDHIVSKRSKQDPRYLRVEDAEQPAPSYSAAMSEKQGQPSGGNKEAAAAAAMGGKEGSPQLQSFDVTIRLPEEEAQRGLLPATYRGDRGENIGRKVAQVFYCVQVIAKRGMMQKDRRVCAPIWVSPGDPFRSQQGRYSEKHGAYFQASDDRPASNMPQNNPFGTLALDARGVPVGWNRLSLLEETIKTWLFKKVASIRIELYTPDAGGISSGCWVSFALLVSAIYLDSAEPPSVEYHPEFVLRRRERRTYSGTAAENRPVQVIWEDATTDGAFYWQRDPTQGSNTNHARLKGQLRIDVPPGFKNEHPFLSVEYDLRLHWTIRGGHKFEKSLIKIVQIRPFHHY